MTDLDLAKIKEAAEKATPGPWTYCPQHIEEGPSAVRAGSRFGWLITTTASDDDALFIALARTAVPALIARLEASEARASTAYAEGAEAAAGRVNGLVSHGTSFRRDAVLAIRSLLKDKPNG